MESKVKTLGLSFFYHDSAAALVDDSTIKFAIHEERISRRKQDDGFPAMAVQAALDWEGIDISDIDRIAFYETPDIKLDRLKQQVLTDWPHSRDLHEKHLPNFLAHKYQIEKIIRQRTRYPGPIDFFEHHHSHAASAFYTSPYEEALILTVDGVGEWDCLGVFTGRGNEIKKQCSVRFPDSLGLFYSTFTKYLGFRVNSGEFKVMGMACYGKPKYLDLILDNILILHKDGSYHLNLKYFNFSHDSNHARPALEKLLGFPPRTPESPKMNPVYLDLAASVQAALELALLALVKTMMHRYGQKNLCMAGGVALNCTANSRIIKELGVVPFIHPAAGDAGGALGAALASQASFASEARRWKLSPYLGRQFSHDAIEAALKRRGVTYTYSDNPARETAAFLANGDIVSIFNGRDEWGPRALGSRSILADPSKPHMQDHLNAKIKFRESFRPFAPIVLQEHYEEFFDTLDMDSTPYMLFTHRVKKPELLPAITHVDGTGRVQTVAKENNEYLYNILQEFKAITGIPALVNTSFNLRGEPIVGSPDDALNTFYNSGIDYLVLENFIIRKAD